MTTTPMRSQYLAIKKQYPDIILFFRLGDFYETFDDDAKIVASVCDVVLTSRPVGTDQRVPLAGVPYHAVDTYIARLINAGYKVAIAEQIGNEPPKGEKLVPRVVRRVVTPGTLVEPNLLPEKRDNYIAALVIETDRAGLAYADITTGEFAATEITDGGDVLRRVAEELGRVAPAEVLYGADEPRWAGRPTTDDRRPTTETGTDLRSTQHAARRSVMDEIPAILSPYHVTPYARWRFEESTARQALLDHFAAASLAGYGCDDKPMAVRAAGAVLQYLRETQRDNVAQITSLRTYSISEYMLLDEATRRNLELTESIRGGTAQGSLLGVLDATLTPMGGRLLRRRLSQPLLDMAALNQRLDDVEAWHDDAPRRSELRGLLRGLGDLERWTNRCVQGVALPRDLVGMREALLRVAQVRDEVSQLKVEGSMSQNLQPSTLNLQSIDPCPDIAALLSNAIADDPPATLANTGTIRPGFSAELDGIHIAIRDAKEWIANLETVERSRTGIKSLKVGYNKVFGYYIEVTQANAALVPAEYIRKQTLVNAERYITPELKEYESLVLNAEERILELEGQLFRQTLAQVAAAAPRLLDAARRIAELDVAATLAEVAEANRYARPVLAEDRIVDIKNGRHPVVEGALAGEPFTPNDVYLSPEQAIVILTGPNMSGKSTFLRQVAHIVLMAQIGSFVPADAAHIGVVDRIFTRIGASDEIARGQSTFMVEMVETANILHHATSRSLLILDEIGRGTSTYDGLAIAWAVAEYIHSHPGLRAKTLFATHYHELTDLAERLPHVVNFNVAVAEQGDSVVFLHKIAPGASDRSYGVHVAQLAGLPKPVVARAQEILADLEASGAAGPRRSVIDRPVVYQLPLFSAEDPVIAELRALDVNSLSPLAALNKLYELQQRVRE
jgi:DNA mismatch repair protein MutS